MSQKGIHTWDLVLMYHRCPHCDYLFESRKPFSYMLGKYKKEETCPRCNKDFILEKPSSHTLGPFFGEPTPTEITWGE